MNEQQHELLNKYEEGLRKMVTEFLTQQKELEGQLLEVDELKEKWKSSASLQNITKVGGATLIWVI